MLRASGRTKAKKGRPVFPEDRLYTQRLGGKQGQAWSLWVMEISTSLGPPFYSLSKVYCRHTFNLHGFDTICVTKITELQQINM